MTDHLRGHSKERLVACPTCGNLFCSRIKLIDHIKRQVPEDCKYCRFIHNISCSSGWKFNKPKLSLVNLSCCLHDVP